MCAVDRVHDAQSYGNPHKSHDHSPPVLLVCIDSYFTYLVPEEVYFSVVM